MLHAYPVRTGSVDSAGFVWAYGPSQKSLYVSASTRAAGATGSAPYNERRPTHQGKDAETPTESEGNLARAGSYPQSTSLCQSDRHGINHKT